ncbi:hypothetical protein [Streptomyces fradiae]|uniref:hypothetical protein n=1 Tax=Streptomyces fradiae TaxID=1906 RepID=UPI003702E698
MTDLTPEDIAAAREEGDLAALLLLAAGITPTVPKQPQSAVEAPCYHIARPGAWPCGTASSGPSPGPRCPACRGTQPTT